MPPVASVLWSALFLLSTSVVLAARPAGPLFDLGDETLTSKVRLSNASASPVRTGGESALRVVFGAQIAYPSIHFEPGRVGYSADWSDYSALAVTVVNAGGATTALGLRIDTRAAADRGRQATAEIPPGKTIRLLMPVQKRAAIVGMMGQPPPVGALPGDVNLTAADTPFDPAGITGIQFYVSKLAGEHTVLIKRVELIAATAPKLPFVDQFGQFNGADWPGKLKRVDEFAQRRDAEATSLARLGPLPDRNRFGGWAGGPKLPATGRFRVQKHEGKWWFVDPEGRLFWSSGITGVRLNNVTRIAGRESFYEWLPARDDRLAQFYGGAAAGRTFDFYAANLFRKYGANFESTFFEVSTRRLISWGVNTIANWSDERAWALRRVPYTIPIHTSGPSFVVAERTKAGKPWVRRFPDPFDPKFRTALDERLATFAGLRNDPWLLGVFIDNELPWAEGTPARTVAAAALALPAAIPVKTALLAQLRAAHSTVVALNAAFGTRFQSWDEAGGPWKLEAAQLKVAEAALAPLDAAIAEQYFRTCREALNRHLPGALYLGCRFHVNNREAIRAAGKYCDVVAFNIYAYHPSERLADEFAREMDFPVIIGEFHFGATDRGMFHPGLRKTENQADRAAKYVTHLTEAATAPWCVGAHWFQYLDQALTGRNDGENYNIGFINATDDSYPELSDAARTFHESLYRVRLNLTANGRE